MMQLIGDGAVMVWVQVPLTTSSASLVCHTVTELASQYDSVRF